MKRLFQYILCSVAMLPWLNSCRDYVEIEPEGNSRVLRYTSDYRNLANNYTSFESGGGIYLLASEDVFFPEAYQEQVNDIWGNSYTWQPAIYNEGQNDSDWNRFYEAVYNANTLLAGVMESENGEITDKQEIMAEAYVHRAFAYLMLVNTYAPHYNETSAASDKAVPLLLTPDLYASLERATVQQVYDVILADLNAALENNIQQTAAFNTLPSATAVYALRARTYLYMGNFEAALEDAEKALAQQHTLVSLEQYRDNPYSYPPLLENPEVILSKKVLNMYTGAPLAAALLDSFEENDARVDVYTINGAQLYPSFEGRGYGMQQYSPTNGVNVGVSVAEMYLIAAECQARLGDYQEAITLLNTLRAGRFASGTEYELSAADATEALDMVLEERRKELIGRGFRWFDQKRLNLEDRYRHTVERIFRGNIYMLEPNSTGYVFPIFQNYIDLNPELGN